MVDIDIGGKEQDEMDDVIPVEEVEVVEEVGVVEDQAEPVVSPPTQPQAGEKKPSPWVKRMIVIAVVIILVIVVVFGYIYLRTEVTGITVDLSHDEPGHDNEMLVTVLASSSGSAPLSGTGKIQITYDNEMIYASDISINDDGTGSLFVPYNSFLEGNGDYFVSVEYEGKESSSAVFSVDFVVESLEIGVWDDFSNEYKLDLRVVDIDTQPRGQLNLTVFMDTDDPRDVEITIDEIKNTDDNSYIIQDGPSQTVSGGSYTGEYDFSQSGNYTISATLTNSMVNSGSNYYTVTQTWEGFLNLLPEAIMEVTDQGGDLLTYNVELDASGSWNDGVITMYLWDFGDGETYSETADDYPDGAFDGKTTHTYSTLSSTTGAGLPQGSYLNTLNVKGDVIDSNTDELEVGALTVQIDAP
jgi:hypothetical protein